MSGDLLHVAYARACNTQQTPPNHATGRATATQQTGLKALANRVLSRNKPRNNRATEGAKGTQQTAQKTSSFVASDLAANIREHFEERAAIREFDGKNPRLKAEDEARKALRVYEYRLSGVSDNPDTWLTLIAPGCNLSQAEKALKDRFGPGRVVAVRER